MNDEKRQKRQDQIEEAAYALLAEKGYAGTSMLSIAKRAKCSNETLYSWFGDKTGLIRALVARNAADVKTTLEAALAEDRPTLKTLDAFGPMLLDLLLSDRPVALNRAAAADPSGELGAALSEAGRETVFPLLEMLFDHARSEGTLHFKDTSEAVELYLGLLIGDLQIRRIIGRAPPLSKAQISSRADTALTRLHQLLT